jgi:MoaA/NifB/PqqE/SkfB family radical SAM enzyme
VNSPRFKIIYLELTNACNFTCDYCPIDRQTRKKEVMPSEFARSILDQIADNRLTNLITFHLMGEPYLHKDLAHLTGYAESKGLRVRLHTNGSLLEKKRNELLFANNLSRLEVGFRTPNDNSFSMRLRGGKLTLTEYLRRTKGLIDDRLRTRARTEICIKLFWRSYMAAFGLADGYEHLTSDRDNAEIVQVLRDHTLERARAYGYDTSPWEGRPVPAHTGDNMIFPGVYLGYSRIQDFWVREQRGNSNGYPAWFGGCSAGFRDDFGILCSGEVTTCCVDYDGRNVIGDLRQQSLMEILASPEAQRIRQSLWRFKPPTEFCRECLGGPTIATSAIKQLWTVATDIKDRIAPRKAYRGLHHRIGKAKSL